MIAETAETAGYGKERSSQCLRHRAFRSCIPGRTRYPTRRPVNSGSGQHSRYWKSPLQCEQADGRRAECLQSGSSDLIVVVSVLSVGDSESLQLGHTAPQKSGTSAIIPESKSPKPAARTKAGSHVSPIPSIMLKPNLSAFIVFRSRRRSVRTITATVVSEMLAGRKVNRR